MTRSNSAATDDGLDVTAAFLVISLFVFLILGIPVAMALGLSSVLTLSLLGSQSLLSLGLKFLHTMQVYPLLAVPFFILAATFMTTGGVARRMIAFAIALVGHMRGGLAMASVLACMLFSAVSGSSPATVVAIGSIVIAGMVRAGYDRAFAAGVICNAGTLGILIPPSIVMIIYGAVTETSVGQLFIAGIVPGLLLALAMMVAIAIIARIKDLPCQPRARLIDVLRAAREAFWGLLLVVIILGGIYGGVFTPTEAAAVSAVYAFVIAVFVYRDIGLGAVPDVLKESSRTIVMLMFIVANAYLFAFVLTTEQIPQMVADSILAMDLSPWTFLLAVNVLLLLAGNFMDPSSVILILAPIIFPIAMELGIDPIHLGVIMAVNMAIGLGTPPVGLNLFVTAGVAKMEFVDVVRAAMPWLLVLLALLIVITYVPALSLALPHAMLGVR